MFNFYLGIFFIVYAIIHTAATIMTKPVKHDFIMKMARAFFASLAFGMGINLILGRPVF